MARELDGLPDLWGLLRRLLMWRRKSRKTAPKFSSTNEVQDTCVYHTRTESAELTTSKSVQTSRYQVVEPTTKSFIVETTSEVQLKNNTSRKSKNYSPVLRQPTLATRLQDQSFLKQAIVVNELLNKPLALRRKRSGLSNRD